MWYKVLCVPDINQVTACADAFVPNTDIRDTLVLGISLQARVNVSLQIDAALICGDRIVPAFCCRAIQGQSQAHRRAFCVGNPAVDIKCGLGLRSRFRLGYCGSGWFLCGGFLFPPASPEARVAALFPLIPAHSIQRVRLPAQKK